MPERIECVDDRSPHRRLPHFLEIDADRLQIFRDIADVLVLGAGGQDLATDHQKRGRDNLFGSGRAAVGMITSLVPQGTPGGRRQQVKVTHEQSGASAVD